MLWFSFPFNFSTFPSFLYWRVLTLIPSVYSMSRADVCLYSVSPSVSDAFICRTHNPPLTIGRALFPRRHHYLLI
ncbi:hypothetical protein XELAEV_18037976mg [Xenopus laevis]|uniref:Secreted protein n=1 Tax=Xenopus laevis TaxID=8355 RepID=A0A974CDU1_XENLA|nr:hypothetical protein XELAEV_18037976mg [Xenopus laevis]